MRIDIEVCGEETGLVCSECKGDSVLGLLDTDRPMVPSGSLAPTHITALWLPSLPNYGRGCWLHCTAVGMCGSHPQGTLGGTCLLYLAVVRG